MTTKDPVTGRPLHDFVVETLAAPTGLPTEGEPIDEPGVQQAAHGGGDRGTPALVFNIKSDANLEETAKAIAKAVDDARLRIAERRQG